MHRRPRSGVRLSKRPGSNRNDRATLTFHKARSANRGRSLRRDDRNVRFSNRPFGVKRFQTIHQHSVDVAHGLVLLFGIGTKALPSWDSKTRRNNLLRGLAVNQTAGPSGHTISPHPSSREGHHSTASSLIGRLGSSAFRLSTTTVSMSLTGSCFSSESAPRPFHHGIRRRGGTIFWAALPSVRTAGPSGHANSPHPSSREGHHSTARWSSSFLLLDLMLHGFHAAAVACSRVQRNSVPSTHMRCMITANRRARATIAFFIPRRLAICIAQALSQDHFFDRSML